MSRPQLTAGRELWHAHFAADEIVNETEGFEFKPGKQGWFAQPSAKTVRARVLYVRLLRQEGPAKNKSGTVSRAVPDFKTAARRHLAPIGAKATQVDYLADGLSAGMRIA
jgi:hypothetical protein